MDQLNLNDLVHVAIGIIVCGATGCDPIRVSFLDAMLVDDLGADCVDRDEIANGIEDHFKITVPPDHPLRYLDTDVVSLRVRDLIEMVITKLAEAA